MRNLVSSVNRESAKKSFLSETCNGELEPPFEPSSLTFMRQIEFPGMASGRNEFVEDLNR